MKEKSVPGRKLHKNEVSMMDSIGLFESILPKRRVSGCIRWLATFCISFGIASSMPDSPAIIIFAAAWLAGNLFRHFQKRNMRYRALEENVDVWDIRAGSFGCPEGRGKICSYYVKFMDMEGNQYEAKLRIGAPNCISAPGTEALLAVYGGGADESCIGITPSFHVYAGYLRQMGTYTNP